MPDSNPETPQDAAPVTPDVMARILEPRVRSNAKNNPRIAKHVAPKTPRDAPDSTEAPAGGELEVLIEDVPGVQAPKSETAPVEPLTETETVPGGDANRFPGGDKVPDLAEVRDLIVALQEEQQKRDRAFDLLYDELSGYKNDFYLERLKPTLRALLFLLDSIEEFEREIDDYEANGQTPTREIVRANLVHFRNQLTDILTLSEMTPLEPEGDKFDPKTQRAIEVVKVEADQNNTVQRQIRGGWRLGGKMLRAADVVVGRS